VGSQAARLLHEAGARIVAVSDLKGAIKNDRGLDIHALLKHWFRGQDRDRIQGCRTHGNPQPFSPTRGHPGSAATENQITEKNAAQVRAKIIVEGANGPTTPEPTRSSWSMASWWCPTSWPMPVVSPSATSSGCRTARDSTGVNAKVNERLVDYMTHAFQATFATTDKYKTNPRIGAYILALDRVAQAMRFRGFYA